jgi:hypothetical protein
VALVLAIEPDLRQAEILTRIVREKVKADVVIVDSREAALEAMRSAVPDVMLLSALLSPRAEDELVAHLRGLQGAEHLQTHTIPQLASAGADDAPGAGRGLLKAFRRRKEAAPAVAGCDPDLFAQEIRVFLEQAEQKRRERAEELQYRPAASPIKPVAPPPKSEDGDVPPPSATTSWDSPFEWRRSDGAAAAAAPLEPKAAASVNPVEPVLARDDDAVAAHLLEPSSLPGHPLEAAVPEIDMTASAPPEPAAYEPPPIEYTAAKSEPIESALLPADHLLESGERTETPELFETFVPPTGVAPESLPESLPELLPESLGVTELPVDFTTVESAIDSSATPQLTEIDEAVESLQFDERVIATPEEIEAYGRLQLPSIEFSPDPIADIASELFTIDPVEGARAAADEISIEYVVPDETPHADPVASTALPIAAAAAHADVSDEEEIDLNCLADEPVSAMEPPDTAVRATIEVEADDDLDTTEQPMRVAEAPVPAPKKAPPNLGPLASWARLENKGEEERRPGSDMREIIERLAVPPHIAGVAYARGVRIRRVRVAASRDRRRPDGQTGPVILSRRALAESRSLNSGA